MSAISQYYVNYHASHYVHNDPNSRNKEFLLTYAKARLRERAQFLKSGVNTEFKNEYIGILNAIMGRSKNDKLNDQAIQKMQETLINYVSDEGKAKDGIDRVINMTSGQVGRQSNKRLEILNRTFKPIKGKYTAKEFLQNILNDYQAALKAANTGKLNKKDLAIFGRVQRYVDQALQTLATLQATAVNTSQLAWAKQYAGKGKYSNSDWLAIAENEGFISRINTVFALINGISHYDQIAQGNLFEYMGVLGSYLMEYGANTALDKTMKDIEKKGGALQGKNTPAIYYNAAGLSDELAAQLAQAVGKSGAVSSADNGKVIVQASQAQQKVDVNITVPGQNKVIPASFKNYSIYSNMPDLGLVNGTNAWYLLTNENYAYLYKYLNVMAAHKLNTKDKTQRAQEQNSISTLTLQRKNAIESFQLLAIYKAISGDTFKRTAAQWLVINNTKTQKIEIIEIGDMISKLLLSGARTDSYFSFPDGTNFNVYYLNDYVGTNPSKESAVTRMAHLLTSVHAQKISVGLKFAGIQKIAPTLI